LPFNGTGASTTTALFNLTNTEPQHSTMAGTGATGLSSGTGGTGVAGYGGASAGNGGFESFGGDGVFARGGKAVGINDIGGNGINANGGTAAGADAGGPGVKAEGGDGSTGGDGIDAYGGNGSPFVGGNGIFAQGGKSGSGNPTGPAGYFNGEVEVNGKLSKSSGSFKIDHPLDPANKYLYHSFVESPDMMNIYNGNVVTDAGGTAVVTMPAWFEALNTDFRYQLTTIGQPAQAWIASEIANGSFTIKTSRSGVKVSWQVTGVRQDAWANANRIQVEVNKSPEDQGHYLHPELFGHEGEPSIPEIHHPRRPASEQQ
jgi:trimeric autotransporter adhesin